MGFYKYWQRCSEGFPRGKVRRKSWGAALQAQRKIVSALTLLPRFKINFYLVSVLALLKCIESFVLTFLKPTDRPVLALLNLYWPSWICIGFLESVLATLNSNWIDHTLSIWLHMEFTSNIFLKTSFCT